MKINKLNNNDYMGIVSLSDFLKEKNREEILESINNAKECNLNVIISKNAFLNDYNSNNTIEAKVNDLEELLKKEEVKIIMSSKGGNNCINLIDKLDYNLIKKTKKIWIGLSDTTVLLNYIFLKTGLITFHYSIFKGFLKGNKEFNKKAFIDMFFNQTKTVLLSQDVKTINEGIGTGTLLGGNLISFNKLINKKEFNFNKDTIFFFEECDEVTPTEIDNILNNLINKNCFNHCKGIILGNYSIDNQYFETVFKNKIKNIPMVKCCDFGHISTNIVLPIGGKIKLDTINKSFTIIENIFN